MKRIFRILVMGALAGVMATGSALAKRDLQKMKEKAEYKTEKTLIKEREKQCDQKIKQYEKEGWKIDGTAKSVRVALMEYYQKLNFDSNYRELVAVAPLCETKKSRNVSQNGALNSAMVKYAQEARSHVAGRVTSDVGTLDETSMDNFYGAYERLVSAEINGELEFQFGVYREVDGKREYEAYYLINEQNASKKRIKAMEAALKESEMAQKYGEKISEFVREGFEMK